VRTIGIFRGDVLPQSPEHLTKPKWRGERDCNGIRPARDATTTFLRMADDKLT